MIRIICIAAATVLRISLQGIAHPVRLCQFLCVLTRNIAYFTHCKKSKSISPLYRSEIKASIARLTSLFPSTYTHSHEGARTSQLISQHSLHCDAPSLTFYCPRMPKMHIQDDLLQSAFEGLCGVLHTLLMIPTSFDFNFSCLLTICTRTLAFQEPMINIATGLSLVQAEPCRLCKK